MMVGVYERCAELRVGIEFDLPSAGVVISDLRQKRCAKALDSGSVRTVFNRRIWSLLRNATMSREIGLSVRRTIDHT